jgi:hypothetical protein
LLSYDRPRANDERRLAIHRVDDVTSPEHGFVITRGGVSGGAEASQVMDLGLPTTPDWVTAETTALCRSASGRHHQESGVG